MPPRFLCLVTAWSFSAFGNYLNLIALSLFTYQMTGSAVGLGVVMAVRLGAGFVAGLFAGRLAITFDRRKLMISADLAQAAVMVLLGLAGAAVGLVGLILVAVVLGAGNTVFTVALRTSVPAMVGVEHRVRANGRLVAGRSVGTVLGYASAGIVMMTGGFSAAFLINAATFVVSATALVLLPLRTRTMPEHESRDEPVAAGGGHALGMLASLYPIVLGMMLVRAADAVGSASHNVSLPVHASVMRPDEPQVFMSQFWTAWAVGCIAGQWGARRSSARSGTALAERTFAVGTGVMSVSFVIAFVGPPGVLLLAVMFLAGLADGLTEVAYVSRLQEAPDKARARLFGLSATAETGGFAVGMVTSALALEAMRPPAVVAVFHALPFAATCALLLALAVLARGDRQRAPLNEPWGRT